MVSAGGQDTGDGSFDIKVPGLYETIEDVLNVMEKQNMEKEIFIVGRIRAMKRSILERQ